MTILVRVESPGYQLIVCGMPTKAWLDWLRTTDTQLTASQKHWRDLSSGDAPPAGRRRRAPRPRQFDLVDTEEL